MELLTGFSELLPELFTRARGDQPLARGLNAGQGGMSRNPVHAINWSSVTPQALRSRDAPAAARRAGLERTVRADVGHHAAADRDHGRKPADDETVARKYQHRFFQNDARPGIPASATVI